MNIIQKHTFPSYCFCKCRVSIWYVNVSESLESIAILFHIQHNDHDSVNCMFVSRYSSSATELSFSWSGFKFLLPVKFYQWGMGTVDAALTSLTCGSLVCALLYIITISRHIFIPGRL